MHKLKANVKLEKSLRSNEETNPKHIRNDKNILNFLTELWHIRFG